MIELDSNKVLDVQLEKETMKVKVIALHKNKKEGVGILLTTPLDTHFVSMGFQWGAFVQFAEFEEGKISRIARKVFEMIGEDEWRIL
jgi:hypothetical protein